MLPTKDAGDVLHEIERELRADEEIWKRIDRDLVSLGHRTRRTTPIVASVLGAIVLLAGSFALGWVLAPEQAPSAAAASQMSTRFTSGGLAEKRDGLIARWGNPEAAMGPAWLMLPGGTGSALTASGLASKREALEARYGSPETGARGPSAQPPSNQTTDLQAKRDAVRARWGTG